MEVGQEPCAGNALSGPSPQIMLLVAESSVSTHQGGQPGHGSGLLAAAMQVSRMYGVKH